jgi:hypothetical protein
MRIRTKEPDRVSLVHIPYGTIFRKWSENEAYYYILCRPDASVPDEEKSVIRSVDLNSGETIIFGPDTLVEQIDAELVIKESYRE